jgi:plastocyanin
MRRLTALAGIGVVLLASGCGGSSSTKGDSPSAAAKPGATVTIPLLTFTPGYVTIKTGQTVTWVNKNDITHEIVEGSYELDKSSGLRTSEKSDGAFSLKVAKKGDTVYYTYPKAGTFTYFCTIHKGMNATVTVQ